MYTNHARSTGIDSMEFTSVSNGNFSVVYVDSPAKTDLIKKQMTQPNIGQQIVAQTLVHGRPALIMQGPLSKEELLAKLHEQGERLRENIPTKKRNPWAIRAGLGFAGQGLQLTASLMNPKKGVDWPLFVFATTNLLANSIALSFGAQTKDDTNRLLFLKEKYSDNLSTFTENKTDLPHPNEDRSRLHYDHKDPKLKERFTDFISDNSVTIGEVALRYLGAFSLAFPANKWGAAKKAFNEGGFEAGYFAHRNPDTVAHAVGLTSMLGKTIALGSKVPDPYDTKPHGFLASFREKVPFKLGGWMEAAGWATMVAHILKNKPEGKPYSTQQLLSAIGFAMFTTAYVIRSQAPYGKMKFDMEELNAHIVDTLAHLPPDKLPQLLADTAASVTEHFKDKKLNFGEVYTQLISDLYRYHHIAIKNNTLDDGQQTIVQQAIPVQPILDLDKNLTKKASFADRELKRSHEEGVSAARG
jgi:hypothetical protein